MDELLKVEAWLETLDFSMWPADEDLQNRWLDSRDSHEFESNDLRVFGAVQERELANPLCPDEEDLVEQIRKTAYFSASAFAANIELPAYVADDFDLIARAARVSYSDFWLDKLRAKYEAGRFPFGTL